MAHGGDAMMAETRPQFWTKVNHAKDKSKDVPHQLYTKTRTGFGYEYLVSGVNNPETVINERSGKTWRS